MLYKLAQVKVAIFVSENVFDCNFCCKERNFCCSSRNGREIPARKRSRLGFVSARSEQPLHRGKIARHVADKRVIRADEACRCQICSPAMRAARDDALYGLRMFLNGIGVPFSALPSGRVLELCGESAMLSRSRDGS